MQLISGIVSNNAAKVRMVLAEKGIPYETIEVPWTKANAWEPKPQILLEHNPRAEVPVLLDGDLTLWDSTVINEYLEDKYPTPALLPTDPEQRALARLWEDEGDHLQTQIVVLIQDVFLATPGTALSDRGQLAQQALQDFVERLGEQLQDKDYICNEFSLADISVFMTIAFAQTLGVAVTHTGVTAWFERMLARSAIGQEFQAIMAGVAALN